MKKSHDFDRFWFVLSTVTLLVTGGAHAQENPCPAEATKNLEGARVLVMVVGESWDSPRAKLQVFERKSASGEWIENTRIADPEASIGEKGLGWGFKYRDRSRANGSQPTDPVKTEGDHKSPAGVFVLGQSFGQAARKRDKNYFQILRPRGVGESTASASGVPTFTIGGKAMVPNDWNCSDDVGNPSLYDQFWHRDTAPGAVKPDSGEQLGANKLYTQGIHVDMRSSAAAQSGSCIFIHHVDEELEATMKNEVLACGANPASPSASGKSCREAVESQPKYRDAGNVATFGCTAIHAAPLAKLLDKVDGEKQIAGRKVAFASFPRSELEKSTWRSCFPGVFPEKSAPRSDTRTDRNTDRNTGAAGAL